MKKTYQIEVDCAACADKMERAAKKTEGVSDCTVNFMMQRMTVEFDGNADADTVMKNVRKQCRKVESGCEVFI